jgi:hypothetical protein
MAPLAHSSASSAAPGVGQGLALPVALARVERFASPEPNTGCWLWMGWVDKQGYGGTWFGKRGPFWAAHRLSWTAHRGPIPAGLYVLHRCDNPACVNPGHLFLGTHQDNMDDMVRKGRAAPAEMHARGERNAKAKLTAEKVADIRTRYASGESLAALGRAFAVTPQAVRAVILRESWRHVA